MDKLYAIQRPDGSLIRDRESGPLTQVSRLKAWRSASGHDSRLYGIWIRGRGVIAWIKDAERFGYRCVEVELAEPGTADALRRAREAWAVIVRIRSHIEADARHFEEQAAALATLHEVLTRVTDTAAREGGEG